MHVRTLMECEALRLAAPHLTPADLAAVRASMCEFDLAAHAKPVMPLSEKLESNWAFHFKLYQASGSTVLMPFIESLWLQLGPIIRAATDVFDPQTAASNLYYHIQIIEALEHGDVAAAIKALKGDIARTFDLLHGSLSAPGRAAAGATP
jgi:DNA-binding GntR family transcriptional regulator